MLKSQVSGKCKPNPEGYTQDSSSKKGGLITNIIKDVEKPEPLSTDYGNVKCLGSFKKWRGSSSELNIATV